MTTTKESIDQMLCNAGAYCSLTLSPGDAMPSFRSPQASGKVNIKISSLPIEQAGSIQSTHNTQSPPPQCRPHALLSSAHPAPGPCAQPSSPTPSDPSAPLSQKAQAHLHQTSRDGSRHLPKCECPSVCDLSPNNPSGKSTRSLSWLMKRTTDLSARLAARELEDANCCRKRSR